MFKLYNTEYDFTANPPCFNENTTEVTILQYKHDIQMVSQLVFLQTVQIAGMPKKTFMMGTINNGNHSARQQDQ